MSVSFIVINTGLYLFPHSFRLRGVLLT